MALVGMDTDLAQQQLAQLQNQGVEGVSNVIQNLNSLLGNIASNWQGQDANAFHDEWTSVHQVNLQNVQTALHDFWVKFQKNITDQIQVSAS